LQIHLDGSSSMIASQEKVFSLLTDPNFIARTLPDAEEVKVLGPDSLEAKIKLRVAVVSSAMKMKMTIAGKEPTHKANLLAEGTGSGSTLKVNSLFTLEGSSPTKMSWTADAEITGVMAGLGSSLLKGFATKKVAEIFEGLTRAVEASS